jgi:hypothetical protein
MMPMAILQRTLSGLAGPPSHAAHLLETCPPPRAIAATAGRSLFDAGSAALTDVPEATRHRAGID